MSNLAEITVEVWPYDKDSGEPDTDHVGISLSANAVSELTDADERHWPGDDVAWWALRDAAGQLARLGRGRANGCPGSRSNTDAVPSPTLGDPAGAVRQT